MHRILIAATCAMVASQAMADQHHDLYDITNWYYLPNTPTSNLEEVMDDGYRPIDLEIRNSNPWRFDCALVANTGNYQTGWWWYTTESEASLRKRLAKNNARLIDIEPHLDDQNNLWYAALAKPNTGSDAVLDTNWATELTESQVDAWSTNNPTRRIHDIQPYQNENGNTRYAITWIGNTGSQFSETLVLTNDTWATLNSSVTNGDLRIVDIERHENGRWSAVLVPNMPGQAWWWFTNQDPADALDIAGNLGARIVDIERYESNGEDRIALLLRRNMTDVALNANLILRDTYDINTDSGLLLKRLGSTNHAWINGTRQFEPASLIKTFHHYHSIRQCALGLDDLDESFFFPLSQNNDGNSCPDPSDPIVLARLDQALRDMMEDSNNSATEAIRNRYGTSSIITSALQAGSEDTELNHIIGCFCANSTWNRTTLVDVANLHNRVRLGSVGSFRDEFYDLMANNWLNLNSKINQELATSSLSKGDRSIFRSLVFSAGKAGSYDCSGGLNNGAYRAHGVYFSLPFLSDCEVNSREYFAGCWINSDIPEQNNQDVSGNNVRNTIDLLYRERIRAAIASWEEPACRCTGDFNGDGNVDGSDMGLLLSQWGPCSGECPGDLNNDGIVDGADFGQFLALWGPCP